MTVKQAVKDQLDLFVEVVDNLVLMLERARGTFNRQDVKLLAELERYQTKAEEEIGLASHRVETHLAMRHQKDRTSLIKLASVLSHLELIAESMNEMILALKKQIREGIPFSQKGIAQTNLLFDGQIEILRALVDIFQTDSEVLKKWICQEKGPELSKACIDFATAHEDRLVEGLCLPHAAPIFLAMLDVVHTITRHEMEISRLLMSDHRGEE